MREYREEREILAACFGSYSSSQIIPFVIVSMVLADHKVHKEDKVTRGTCGETQRSSSENL